MVGMKSSATVQQMQPLASSTIFSSGQLASAQDFRISPSTPSLPNSLTSTAFLSSVVCFRRGRTWVFFRETKRRGRTVPGFFGRDLRGRPPAANLGGEGGQGSAGKNFPAGGAGARAHRPRGKGGRPPP